MKNSTVAATVGKHAAHHKDPWQEEEMLTDKNKLPVLNLKLLNVKLPSISPRLLHHFSSDFFQKRTGGGGEGLGRHT